MRLKKISLSSRLELLFPPPKKWLSQTIMLMPLLASLFLQRFQYIIDNRYINSLGASVFSIHNIQCNLLTVGQALGAASATSCLILWNRAENRGRQGSILLSHIFMPLFVAGAISIGVIPLYLNIFHRFHIAVSAQQTASTYFNIGLISMTLQCLYGALNGILIASDRRTTSMLFSGAMVLIKVFSGKMILSLVTSKQLLPERALILFGWTTVLVFTVFGLASYLVIKRHVDGWKPIRLREILPIWTSELGIGVIRSISPLLYTYQLGSVQASAGFFVTYQLTLQLAYLFCLPYSSGIQLAVRDASSEASQLGIVRTIGSTWLSNLIFVAFIPTLFLLLIGSLIPEQIFRFVYGYSIPEDHISFSTIYFLSCVVGQLGHIFVVKLRASKRNALATRNFLFTEFGIQIALTQFLIYQNKATPSNLGLVITAYCISYVLLNAISSKTHFGISLAPATLPKSEATK